MVQVKNICFLLSPNLNIIDTNTYKLLFAIMDIDS